MMKGAFIFAFCALLICSVAADASFSRRMLASTGAEGKARKCFELWNKALATKKANVVTERYRYDGNKYGVLVPTLSNVVRHDREGILDYFVEFLKKSPQGKIVEIYAKQLSGGNVAASGLYNFYMTADGKDSVVPARFTYVFTKNCKILEHHSSEAPEA